MQNRAITTEQRPQRPLHNVMLGTVGAAHRAGVLLCEVADGVTVLRQTVRRMPLVMTVLVLGLGYVIGTVRYGMSRDDRRQP
jgi:hypothetical protein